MMNKRRLRISICTQYDPTIMDRIHKQYPQVAVDVFTDDEKFLQNISDSDIILLQKEVSIEISRRIGVLIGTSERVKWLHWGYTGLDRIRPLESLETRLHLTNSKSVAANAIADYVITVIYMLHREFPKLMRNQNSKIWERCPSNPIRGKTVGIIGLGNIGRRVARHAKHFEMKVMALARRPVSLKDVDAIYYPMELKKFLGEADIVVVCVPLTTETRELIGEEALASMRPGSYLINVARGCIVDEEALVRALKKGHLAGAVMDAFAQEPLPPDSELWSLHNVIVTPHLSGWTEDYPERIVDFFCKNLGRFLVGKKLMNIVEWGKGY